MADTWVKSVHNQYGNVSGSVDDLCHEKHIFLSRIFKEMLLHFFLTLDLRSRRQHLRNPASQKYEILCYVHHLISRISVPHFLQNPANV